MSARIVGVAIVAFVMLNALIWYAAVHAGARGVLTVSFLNVGQGDSIFIESPAGVRVLIDGGPDSSVVRELARVIPWYERSIDTVIATHPDADHTSGLIDVLTRFHASIIMQSSVEGSTPTWNVLESDIQKAARAGAKLLSAQRGQVIALGNGAYLEILSPDRTVPHVDTNTGCIVARLVYGDTAFMFSCDAPQNIEKYLVHLDGHYLKSDVLKAGHHGSKTSSSELFVGYVDPDYVVYSRGCHNTYGFPHQQTIDTMARFGIKTLDTCETGTITFESDGERVVHI